MTPAKERKIVTNIAGSGIWTIEGDATSSIVRAFDNQQTFPNGKKIVIETNDMQFEFKLQMNRLAFVHTRQTSL